MATLDGVWEKNGDVIQRLRPLLGAERPGCGSSGQSEGRLLDGMVTILPHLAPVRGR